MDQVVKRLNFNPLLNVELEILTRFDRFLFVVIKLTFANIAENI